MLCQQSSKSLSSSIVLTGAYARRALKALQPMYAQVYPAFHSNGLTCTCPKRDWHSSSPVSRRGFMNHGQRITQGGRPEHCPLHRRITVRVQDEAYVKVVSYPP